MLLLPEHASPARREEKVPTGVEVLPNLNIEAIAADCASFRDRFLTKYIKVDTLLEETEKHSPELHELLYSCIKPIEDFVKNDFDDCARIAGKAAKHGWSVGYSDGMYKGMREILSWLEQIIHTEVVQALTEEEWEKLIREERERVSSAYYKANGGAKVMWKFDEQS